MPRQLDEILVVDVESTCWSGEPPPGQTSEIIEIGVCPVNFQTLTRGEKRSLLVRPEHSKISPFCTQLTTLRPEMFDDAMRFPEATRILKKEYQSKKRLWASWGDYDRRQFERVCKLYGAGYPFDVSHLNVKTLFALGLSTHETGMENACQRLGLPLEGTHHRGDDDAWNIAGILCEVLKRLRSVS